MPSLATYYPALFARGNGRPSAGAAMAIAAPQNASRVMEIAGNIDGNLSGEEIMVTRDATVTGDLGAERIVVHGRVIGSIRARSVEISGTGRIDGELHYGTLVVAEGGRVEARCVPW